MSSHADAEHSPDAKRRSPECLGEVAKSDEDYEKKFFNNVTTPTLSLRMLRQKMARSSAAPEGHPGWRHDNLIS
jgi:hypothetical protein